MNTTDMYTDLVYDYIHNKCKIDPNHIYYKNNDTIKRPPLPIQDEIGTKDIFYTGGSNTTSTISKDITHIIPHSINNLSQTISGDAINVTDSINISFQSHIMSILKTPPFNSIYSIDELSQLLPILSKYSTHNFNYIGPDKLNNYLRQYTEVLSSALKESVGRDIIQKTISLSKWTYLNDIKSDLLACLLPVSNIFQVITQYLFLCYNVKRQLPRYEIIVEASKQLSNNLSKWMFQHRYDLLPDGSVLNTSLNEYGKQYTKEYDETYQIIKNNRNFYNPFEPTLSNNHIFQNWDNLDTIYKYLLSLQFNIKPSNYELVSLSCLLNKPIFIMIGYKNQLVYSPINAYTPFKYDKIIDIPISIIMDSDNNYHLLWFKHFNIPLVSLCSYPTVSNQTIYKDKKPIRLNIIGSSKFIINKDAYDITNDINQLDKSIICDIPSFLKQLSNSSMSITPILNDIKISQNMLSDIAIENTYKIGNFTYTNKVINILQLINKKLPKSIINADIPIDVFIFMKYGVIQLFNLSTRNGQTQLNKAIKDGYIIRNSL
jgi:hypothetical protein